jgi:acyl-CoA thioester hydrolase
MEEKRNTPFEYRLSVTKADIDELGHTNNVVYLRWVQEAAAAHWNHIAGSELNQRYVWVVVRHEIDYLQPAFLNDAIIAYTWVGEHTGAKSERYVDICNAATGKKLAAAKTTWCLLDAVTLRPRRIEEDIRSVLG